MIKSGIDQDALVTMFAEASAKQGEALRKAVSNATLQALQGRELTLDSIKKVVKTIAGAASLGAARNPASAVDVEAMLGKALAGIDSALLQAVEANRKALQQFVSTGVGLTEKPMKDALANIERMEDTFFDAVAKASKTAGPMQAPWEHVLVGHEDEGQRHRGAGGADGRVAARAGADRPAHAAAPAACAPPRRCSTAIRRWSAAC